MSEYGPVCLPYGSNGWPQSGCPSSGESNVSGINLLPHAFTVYAGVLDIHGNNGANLATSSI